MFIHRRRCLYGCFRSLVKVCWFATQRVSGSCGCWSNYQASDGARGQQVPRRGCSGSKPVKIITQPKSRVSQIRPTARCLAHRHAHPEPFFIAQSVAFGARGGGRTDGRAPSRFVSPRARTCRAAGWAQSGRCKTMPRSWIFYLFIINTRPGSQEQTLKDRCPLRQRAGIFMASFQQSASLKCLNKPHLS